jgi:hypothetical protein
MSIADDPLIPGAIIAPPAAVLAWLPQLNEWMQVGASAVAMTAGGVALLRWYRERKGSAQGRQPALGQSPSVSPRSAVGPADSQDK